MTDDGFADVVRCRVKMEGAGGGVDEERDADDAGENDLDGDALDKVVGGADVEERDVTGVVEADLDGDAVG